MDVDDVLNDGESTGRTCASVWQTVSDFFSTCPDALAEQCPQTCNVPCPGKFSTGMKCFQTLCPILHNRPCYVITGLVM